MSSNTKILFLGRFPPSFFFFLNKNETIEKLRCRNLQLLSNESLICFNSVMVAIALTFYNNGIVRVS